ncbi:MAG TPA: sigma 54-interacting transcriptional regulator [Thermodesulfobacteriota bacterium]|nr:sigma 54-interacting transcriptional regulator [Thermodesulfobacteriota bacterium]
MTAQPAPPLSAERQPEALALFLEVSRSFHALVDVEELLPVVTERVRALLDAEACSVILYDPERHELFFPAVRDERLPSPEPFKELRFPADQGVAGWALREGRSVLVPDVAQDPRFYPAVDRQLGVQTRSLICAPLRTRSGVIGVTQVINKKAGEFTADDLALLDAVAGSLAVALENARLHQALRREKEAIEAENAGLRRELCDHFRAIVGASPALRAVLEQARQAAPTRATITLLGESGTGKELVARAIHDASDRARGPFVVVNCGAIPATLLEAELFGHEKGAFTGATTARRGKFELAHGGTLFLDEIGDLELALQAKLLRAIQTGEIQRLGSEQPRTVDVRVITATNRDLQALMAAGRFREDLYWRINVITLELPPLRARREDLPLLIRHFLARFARELGKPRLALDPEAEAALLAYEYPGNVRELENILHRAAILSRGARIALADLPPRLAATPPAAEAAPRSGAALKAAKARAAREAADRIERGFLIELLRSTGGNVSLAARRAGMNRSWLHHLLNRHRLDPAAFR